MAQWVAGPGCLAGGASLRALTAALLGRRLDKSEQRSDWGAEQLADTQVGACGGGGAGAGLGAVGWRACGYAGVAGGHAGGAGKGRRAGAWGAEELGGVGKLEMQARRYVRKPVGMC